MARGGVSKKMILKLGATNQKLPAKGGEKFSPAKVTTAHSPEAGKN